MTYLLDVNALIALAVVHHEFHHRVASWVASMRAPELATCSIIELGFIRVLGQATAYGYSVVQARALLRALKKARIVHFSFLEDDHDSSFLPNWVRAPKQLTDGHLTELAASRGAILATLDENIPGSFVIPS